MNSELKLVIFEEKKILQSLLELLDEQYSLILSKDIIGLGKIADKIEEVGKNLAASEIKRRKIVSEEEFNNFIKNINDEHIKGVYEEIKNLLNNLQNQKDTNNTLIKQRLFFTNKMINVIKPSKGIGTYNSYGKVGR
ncbi:MULTISPECIES: flagellar protein FlgN [Clostridium]|uniref:flagellar protein FlgN n=1 Tax=Clostridium TaxID=1485 RepID=UPI0008222C5B|nr:MULTISPECIES: flagellar protein FlgN [Clostridium]MBX9183267.1 flagellar protein FlgN [Clostridium sp. K04]MDU3520660.1 flagellar protein FlgN [Clostridium saudiense]SCJ67613.1 FlgN protein [uncultured Clostridium sp.]